MKRQGAITKYGFFNLDKPSGLTSSTLVNKCKWLSGVPCGHMGTLDPLASGVLPVGVGRATRLFDYFLDKEKIYIAEFTFGESSETLDTTVPTIKGGRIPSRQEIVQVLPELCGDILQIPPKYSAKNVNGRRGYDLARAGIEFELAPKKVRIESVQLLGVGERENAYQFQIVCGGGTYIRSIARDMAEMLGTNAVMSALRRTKSGCFEIQNAVDFALFEQDPDIAELEKWLIPTESVLPFPILTLSTDKAEKLFCGASVSVDEQDGLYKIYKDDAFYGIAQVQAGIAKVKTKLC